MERIQGQAINRIFLRLSQSQILFKNESPGDSTKCRPLLILYEEETSDLTITEFNKLEKALDMPATIEISLYSGFDMQDLTISVKLVSFPTMFDGKCINAILKNRATTRCRACKLTYNDFGSNLLILKSES